MNNCQGINTSTRLFVIVAGILAGLSGVVHGFTETLKGNTPTGRFYLENFGAFSVIPNFLVTGIASILVALTIAMWAVGFIHKRNGPNIFMGLSILLFFVGGGVAHLGFCLITWGAAAGINSPLSWWKMVLSQSSRMMMAKWWLAAFITGFLLVSIGIGIWLIWLTPGSAHNGNVANYVCWGSLAVGLVFLILALVSGFARDIQRRQITR